MPYISSTRWTVSITAQATSSENLMILQFGHLKVGEDNVWLGMRMLILLCEHVCHSEANPTHNTILYYSQCPAVLYGPVLSTVPCCITHSILQYYPQYPALLPKMPCVYPQCPAVLSTLSFYIINNTLLDHPQYPAVLPAIYLAALPTIPCSITHTIVMY